MSCSQTMEFPNVKICFYHGPQYGRRELKLINLFVISFYGWKKGKATVCGRSSVVFLLCDQNLGFFFVNVTGHQSTSGDAVLLLFLSTWDKSETSSTLYISNISKGL